MVHKEGYIMLRVLRRVGCDKYQCFGSTLAVCVTTNHLYCDGMTVVSTKLLKKRAWLSAVIAAVTLFRNLEILASTFVVVISLFLCMRMKDRQGHNMSYGEMGRTITEQLKAVSGRFGAEGVEGTENWNRCKVHCD